MIINGLYDIDNATTYLLSDYFKSWKGLHFGSLKIRIGEVMDSLYCLHDGEHKVICPFHERCTSIKYKDSLIKEKCPFPNEIEEFTHHDFSDVRLDLRAPSMNLIFNLIGYIHGNRNSTYTKGARALCGLLGLSEQEYYNHVVAKEYIDFMLPERDTSARYITERDFLSFYKWFVENDLNFLHCWGTNVRDSIKDGLESLGYHSDELDDKERYITIMTKGNKQVIILCSYHPASSKYYHNGKLQKYAALALSMVK